MKITLSGRKSKCVQDFLATSPREPSRVDWPLDSSGRPYCVCHSLRPGRDPGRGPMSLIPTAHLALSWMLRTLSESYHPHFTDEETERLENAPVATQPGNQCPALCATGPADAFHRPAPIHCSGSYTKSGCSKKSF